jgi:hypothetical protein
MTLKLLDVLAAGRIYGSTIDEGDADPATRADRLVRGGTGGAMKSSRIALTVPAGHVSAGPRLPPWGG